MTIGVWRVVLAASAVAVAAAGCVRHLPEQDLRILNAQPSAKLSASDLWADFQKDAAAARAQYFGKAVDVSDAPTSVEPEAPGGPSLVFGQGGERAVRARLLEDQAAGILKEARPGARLTIRCFCEGPDDRGDVVLKSCIRP